MLKSNRDIADCLINEQLDTVFNFQYSESTITKAYIKFDDFNEVIINRDSDNSAKVNGVVPLEKIELDIIFSKSSTVFVKCIQFLAKLAFACAIHKFNLWITFTKPCHIITTRKT